MIIPNYNSQYKIDNSDYENKILQDPVRSCKIPRATADNIRQLKLTENWPIILWRKFDSYPHDFCLTSKVEKLKRETTTTTTTDKNKQWQALETPRSTSLSKNS